MIADNALKLAENIPLQGQLFSFLLFSSSGFQTLVLLFSFSIELGIFVRIEVILNVLYVSFALKANYGNNCNCVTRAKKVNLHRQKSRQCS